MPMVLLNDVLPTNKKLGMYEYANGADISDDLNGRKFVFLEAFCDNHQCDCEEAFISVYEVDVNNLSQIGEPLARIHYEWSLKKAEGSVTLYDDMEQSIHAKNIVEFYAGLIAKPEHVAQLILKYKLLKAHCELNALKCRHTTIADQVPGRNDPCHCGSGKKYKKCCLKDNVAGLVSHSSKSANN